MRAFVLRRNIARYKKQLETEPDEVRRRTIMQLLQEEEGKLAEHVAAQPGKAAE